MRNCWQLSGSLAAIQGTSKNRYNTYKHESSLRIRNDYSPVHEPLSRRQTALMIPGIMVSLLNWALATPLATKAFTVTKIGMESNIRAPITMGVVSFGKQWVDKALPCGSHCFKSASPGTGLSLSPDSTDRPRWKSWKHISLIRDGQIFFKRKWNGSGQKSNRMDHQLCLRWAVWCEMWPLSWYFPWAAALAIASSWR